KGGDFRKWYGNYELVVDWESDGRRISSIKPKSVIRSPDEYFKASISCGGVTNSTNAFRFYPVGAIFDVNTRTITFDNMENFYKGLLCLSNSRVIIAIIAVISPTAAFNITEYK